MSRLGKRFEGHARGVAMTRCTGSGPTSASPSRALLEPHPAKGSRPSVGVGEIYSTLFNQNSGKHRTYLKGVPVILQGIGRITYWGQELRAEVLVHTELARAQPATVILKLFKLAVRVVQHKDRIKLHLPTSCPIKPLLATVTEILYQVRPAPCNTS